MTTTVHLYERKTHRYADGWADLDEHQYLGTVKLAGPTLVARGNRYDEGDTVRYTTRLPAGMDPKAAIKALRATLGGSNCRHEYDCCGCASHHVLARLTAPRRLSVTVFTTFNY